MNSQQSKGRPKEPLGETYTDEEIARRRDEALLRALNTPPKRHSEMKLGKRKAKASQKATGKKRGTKKAND